MKRHMWWLVLVVFSINIVLQTVLAWDGSHFSLVTLAVTSLFLVLVLVMNMRGWRNALEGWGRSTTGWSAAQTWGIKQDQILRDVLKELYEYDEEAVEIHYGRSKNASLEYLKTFEAEDTAAIIAELQKEGL